MRKIKYKLCTVLLCINLPFVAVAEIKEPSKFETRQGIVLVGFYGMYNVPLHGIGMGLLCGKYVDNLLVGFGYSKEQYGLTFSGKAKETKHLYGSFLINILAYDKEKEITEGYAIFVGGETGVRKRFNHLSISAGFSLVMGFGQERNKVSKERTNKGYLKFIPTIGIGYYFDP